MTWLIDMSKKEQLQGTPKLDPEKPQDPLPKEVAVFKNSRGQFLINQAGFELVKHFEGCYLRAYQDSVGVWTIGWGRIKYDNGGPIEQFDVCTQAEADTWLLEDLENDGGRYVRAYISEGLNPNQFSALCSFTYNRGAGRLKEAVDKAGARGVSALAEVILQYDWAGADHKYLLGLDRRRHAERELFNGNDWRKFDTVAKFQKWKGENLNG